MVKRIQVLLEEEEENEERKRETSKITYLGLLATYSLTKLKTVLSNIN